MQEQYESLKFWEQATAFAQKNPWAKPLIKFCLNIMVTAQDVANEHGEDISIHPTIQQRLQQLHRSLN